MKFLFWLILLTTALSVFSGSGSLPVKKDIKQRFLEMFWESKISHAVKRQTAQGVAFIKKYTQCSLPVRASVFPHFLFELH